MDEALEFHHCDVAAVTVANGVLCIELSRASFRSGDKQWTQRARIRLEDGQVLRAPSEYPVAIFDGSFESDFERFDHILPVPFSKRGRFTVRIFFANGEQLRIVGHNPDLEIIEEDSGRQQASHF